MSKNHTRIRALRAQCYLGGAHVAGTPDPPTVTTWPLALPQGASLSCLEALSSAVTPGSSSWGPFPWGTKRVRCLAALCYLGRRLPAPPSDRQRPRAEDQGSDTTAKPLPGLCQPCAIWEENELPPSPKCSGRSETGACHT